MPNGHLTAEARRTRREGKWEIYLNKFSADSRSCGEVKVPIPEVFKALALRTVASCVIVKLMKKTRSKKRDSQDAATRQPLQELRDALLDLHKILIDSERAVYEANLGPIHSPHHFFQLLSSDPWFAWLRPVSQLIVAMDEALDAEESLTNDSVNALMNESVFLLLPAERGGEFGERYMAALQRDPQVVLAHAKVAKHIGSKKSQA
jgi:hypothetical protein